mmetsp:Transcript_26008/g.72862  ORF Transcript_26008/g.72862 Transcript_26008/m.72862 type:complete len:282 (+) Transcript_26008:1330-2175(+)
MALRVDSAACPEIFSKLPIVTYTRAMPGMFLRLSIFMACSLSVGFGVPSGYHAVIIPFRRSPTLEAALMALSFACCLVMTLRRAMSFSCRAMLRAFCFTESSMSNDTATVATIRMAKSIQGLNFSIHMDSSPTMIKLHVRPKMSRLAVYASLVPSAISLTSCKVCQGTTSPSSSVVQPWLHTSSPCSSNSTPCRKSGSVQLVHSRATIASVLQYWHAEADVSNRKALMPLVLVSVVTTSMRSLKRTTPEVRPCRLCEGTNGVRLSLTLWASSHTGLRLSMP